MMTVDAGTNRALGTSGLLCGALAVFPFGIIAGVPAVVLSVLALVNEPRSRDRSIAGLALGVLGIALSSGLLYHVTRLTGHTRPAAPPVSDETTVKYNMYSLQESIEEWAEANSGAYPPAAEFSSDSSSFMVFLARDRVG